MSRSLECLDSFVAIQDSLHKWERLIKQLGPWCQSSGPYPLHSLTLQFWGVRLKRFCNPSFLASSPAAKRRRVLSGSQSFLFRLAPVHFLFPRLNFILCGKVEEQPLLY